MRSHTKAFDRLSDMLACDGPDELMAEMAADEIERLRDELAEARRELRAELGIEPRR